MVEVGELYRRNGHHRDSNVPAYFVIVVHVGLAFINCRRQKLSGGLIHEDVKWMSDTFDKFFELIK